ncbi:TonB-dependent receptor plug [Pseudopedobacter saltans DSM 12145]|uniref:TonB-dependent receptor plug n=1 Tax=Pseudopedobacter saltans (strain ATCC 51119 / DSM 12145 / JCM 21818 / CCUG 39354 / LMG 10337 / NBRC 100064 / NCIMB 13643) TaxID=762903 RepID=F0SAJ7_PSESL|nr:TonB-dependent receptor [Pseudopedobacter saltans]ADY52617.1 TonB-dependent receptor plug [Pseudopedobacter saltans DSM 12145]
MSKSKKQLPFAFFDSQARLFKICFITAFALCLSVIEAVAQIKVTGVVKESNGDPLPGVAVKVKGSQSGTQTNVNGQFSLTVPGPDAVLSFSYIGFVTKDVKVSNQTAINVTLVENANDLDEVVVLGYGQTSTKRDLTGSQSSVTSKDIAERQPVTLFDALQGQASGVQVVNDNGDPMGQGTIQIRGASSINATGVGPLYVIDGVISENGNFVNPQDIESIEILKDIASASIYGARGANGVILITTKKGKEGKPLIAGQYTFTLGELAHKIRTTSADELRYYRMIRGGGINFAGNVDSVNPYLNADNDYQDLLFRTSKKHVANLSLSGGQKGLTYYAGLNYTDNQALVLNSWMKRVQSKVNVTYQISPKLSVSNNLAFAYQTGNIINLGNSAKQIFERNPWTSLYRPDGELAGVIESKRNPVAYALLDKNLDNNYVSQFNTQFKYKIIDGLSFSTMFTANLDNNNNREVVPARITTNGISEGFGSSQRKVYWESQSVFNYEKIFNKVHNFSAVAGFTLDRRRTDNYKIRVTNLLNEDIFMSNVGTIDVNTAQTGTSATANSNVSILARANYSYQGKYMLQGTFRRDGSSRFGPNSKWGDFFSTGAAWRFTSEKFMEWTKGIIDDGKLRFSVGSAGNDAIGNYMSYTTVKFGDYYYNGQLGASADRVLGNSAIQWETTTATNYGIDLSFLKGRVTLTAEYYDKITKDLLYTSELGKESGKYQVVTNLGKIQNKGFELTVLGTPIANKDFVWDVNANMTLPKSKIKELANGTSFITGNKWLVKEGGKIGDFYLFINEGVYQYDVSNAYTPDNQRLTPVDVVVSADGKSVESVGGYTLNGQPYTGPITSKYYNGVKLQGGDTIWQDTNNDGTIDDNDKVIAGNGLPTFYFGLNNTFRYKQFSLSFLFNGQFGNKVYNAVANGQNTTSSTYTPPIWDMATTSWFRQGDITQYPLVSRQDTRGSIRNNYNSLYLEDGSFIRLSSARLAYTLDKKLASKIAAKSATVYLFGQNLLTWTNYSWFDPEFSTSNQLQPGNDTGKYPKVREFGLGLNVNF